MKALRQFGTPLMLGFLSSFSRSPGQAIEKSKNSFVGHATIVVGVSVDDDGTVHVMYRDSNNPPDTYDTQTLTEFLTPRYGPERMKHLKTLPGITDTLWMGKMRSDEKTKEALTNKHWNKTGQSKQAHIGDLEREIQGEKNIGRFVEKWVKDRETELADSKQPGEVLQQEMELAVAQSKLDQLFQMDIESQKNILRSLDNVADVERKHEEIIQAARMLGLDARNALRNSRQ